MRSRGRLLGGLALAVLMFGCSSSRAPSTGAPSSGGSSSPTVPATESASAAARAAAPFDLLLDTGGYSDGQIVLIHKGVVRPLSHVSFPVVGPVLRPDHRAFAFSSPHGIGVMTLGGKLVTTLPHTSSCFVGAWVSASELAANCVGASGWPPPIGTWHVVVLAVGSGKRLQLGQEDPGSAPGFDPTTGDVVFSLDGTAYEQSPTGGSRRRLQGPAPLCWSADGSKVAVVTGSGTSMAITISNVRTKTQAKVPLGDWSGDLTAAFSADGRFLVYAGSADTSSDAWFAATRDGRATQLTDSGSYGDVAPI